MRLILVAIAAVIVGSVQVPAPPVPQASRTGMIVGQVIDASTGQPVSEAIVRLQPAVTSETMETVPSPRVMADAEGRFFFSELPAGSYGIQATKDGYAPGWHGQRQPWGSSTTGITLAEGERRTDVAVQVWKYAVIGGTVVDEAGEPMVGVAVRALPKNLIAGRLRYGNRQLIPELVPYAVTDDRGIFRFTQITPGTFVVVVPSTHSTVPASTLANLDTAARNELFRVGMSEISPPGQPRTLSAGDFALLTLNRVAIPPPPAPNGRMQVYKTTYYPAAATPGTASPVTVKAGDERTDLTIALRPVPAVTISGRLVAPDGSAVLPMAIRLVGEAMADVVTAGVSNPGNVGLETVTGLSDARGRFMLIGVPPGGYVLSHGNPYLISNVRQDKPAYWLSQPIAVGSEDIRDLTIELRPALRIEGRVEFREEGDTKPSTRPRNLVVFETPFGEPGGVAVEGESGTATFFTVAAAGQFIVRVVDMGGWFLRSITLEGKDITERAFDLQADTRSIVITYTDRPSKVSGTVTDARGTPSASAMVLVFPTDRERWSGYGATPRLLRSAATSREGVYSFPHLLPGEYHAIAVEPGDADGWQDPARLEVFATLATRLTIGPEDAAKTVDLRVRRTP